MAAENLRMIDPFVINNLLKTNSLSNVENVASSCHERL